MTVKQIAEKAWYAGFVLAAFAWLAGHYYIERHAPEFYIVASVGLMTAYGVWGFKKDLTAFGKDVGEAYHEIKDADSNPK